MQLTREQAIAEHRKMWNWIAEQIKSLKAVVNIYDFKRAYCLSNGFGYVKAWCILCDYAHGCCSECPVEWEDYSCEGDISNKNYNGIWYRCKKAKNWQEQAALARQIANLPERTDV